LKANMESIHSKWWKY